jgi:hypothetical protein
MPISGHESPVAKTMDWITPQWILSPLGEFDVDPCASKTQPWPTAKLMVRLPDDGLAKEWAGRVWLNPPYGRETGAWLKRLAEHGNGIALVFARTETRMFRDSVWPFASGLLFLQGRVQFCRPDGSTVRTSNAGAPSVLIGYGSENARILRECGLPGAFCFGWSQS